MQALYSIYSLILDMLSQYVIINTMHAMLAQYVIIKRLKTMNDIHLNLCIQVMEIKDLRLDLRSRLPDIDQMRGRTEVIGPSALDQLCPSPRLIYGMQKCPKISLKLYYDTLHQTISNRHRNEFNL